MTIDTWEPAKPQKLSSELLAQYVAVAAAASPVDVAAALTAEQRQQDNWLMTLPAVEWRIADELESEAVIDLARFFTLVEKQQPGWEGGKSSPVIYLVKILKQRKAFDDDLRRWIKANTDNRYLPNGAVLL